LVLFGALLSVLVLLFTAGPAGATGPNGQSVHGHAGARPAHRQVVKRPAGHPAGKAKASRAVQQQRTTDTARADRTQPADLQGQTTDVHGQHTATGQAAGDQGLTAAAPSATQRAIQQAAQAAAQLAAQAAAELAAQAAAQLAAQAAEQAAQQASRQAPAGQPSTGQPGDQPSGSQQPGSQPVAIQPADQAGSRAASTSSRQAQHGTATAHPATKPAPESLPHRMISTPVVPIIALATATLSVGSGPALIVLIVIAGAGLLLVAAGTRRSALHR
jgi:hypothetical protein